MGRVDAAMRRAADGTPETAVETASVPEVSAASFAPEAPGASDTHVDTMVLDGPVDGVEAAEPFDNQYQDAGSVEESVGATGAGDSGMFEYIDTKLAQKVVVDAHMKAAPREQYRRLASSLHRAQLADGLSVIMIASAVPGEGKTLTATNLALTLSESYNQAVLLIDADFRRPSMHTVFQLNGSPGLTEMLSYDEDQRLPLHRVSQHLTVLTAGTPSSDPMAVLTSPRMRRIIDEARQMFTWVIIDTPPIGLLTDASLLTTLVDGAILIVKAGSTHFDLVKRAVAAIGPERTLGVVLNRATKIGHGYGYGYGYGYHDYSRYGTSK